MPQMVFTLIGWAISFSVLIISFIGFVHDKVDFIGSFFVNQSILYQEYDFIIVGGGSAGSVLAARLSEDPDTRVLLLEAGGSPPFLASIPVLGAFLQKTYYDWQYKTVPQKNACKAMKDQKSIWPRGKMLGGCSSLNYLFYVRGDSRDFNYWQEQFGLEGWGYEDILPYFLRAENYQEKFNNSNKERTQFYGRNGELPIRDSLHLSPLAKVLQKIAEKQNKTDIHGEQDDEDNLNDGFLDGFRIPRLNIDAFGKRADTYSSFLKPEETKRKNLAIATHVQANRIIFDDKKKARAVEVNWFGRKYSPRCRKEVVVSAGTIGSPFILLHSGIGPALQLKRLDIEPLVDNPEVGENLQDHVTTLLGPFLINKPITFSLARLMVNPFKIWEYIINGTGPLTTTVAGDSIVFIKTNKTDNLGPDIQYHINGVAPYSDFGAFFHKIFGFEGNWWKEFYGPHYAQDAATILPIVLHPQSRGRLWLQSSSPDDPPYIDPKYYSHPQDIQTMIKAIKLILEIIENSPELKKFGFELPAEPVLPMCQNMSSDHKDDNYWECFARHLTMSMYHPTGTCAMGKVVDNELKVIGVDNLRIVDASVMPEITSGNTNAPVIMIAEKASDMIRNYWELPILNEAKQHVTRNTTKKKDEL